MQTWNKGDSYHIGGALHLNPSDRTAERRLLPLVTQIHITIRIASTKPKIASQNFSWIHKKTTHNARPQPSKGRYAAEKHHSPKLKTCKQYSIHQNQILISKNKADPWKLEQSQSSNEQISEAQNQLQYPPKPNVNSQKTTPIHGNLSNQQHSPNHKSTNNRRDLSPRL